MRSGLRPPPARPSTEARGAGGEGRHDTDASATETARGQPDDHSPRRCRSAGRVRRAGRTRPTTQGPRPATASEKRGRGFRQEAQLLRVRDDLETEFRQSDSSGIGPQPSRQPPPAGVARVCQRNSIVRAARVLRDNVTVTPASECCQSPGRQAGLRQPDDGSRLGRSMPQAEEKVPSRGGRIVGQLCDLPYPGVRFSEDGSQLRT